MFGLVEQLALRFLRTLDAETAHGIALKALQLSPRPPAPPDDPRLAVEAFGLSFPNPVGVAAGLDKNAEAPDVVLRAGFGFVEAGTVTPLPQAGNPRPRIFRLPRDEGIINRLGFNNEGHAAALARLRRRAGGGGAPAGGGGRAPAGGGRASGGGGIVGINIGANKDAPNRVADYVNGISAFAEVVDYFTVNISSPNTPGLRDLQQAAALDDLLGRVMDARAALPPPQHRPILLKVAPDLTLGDLDDVVAVARRRRVDGLIISNTTLSRPPSLLDKDVAGQAGGLSGRPLFPLSTRILAEAYVRAEGAFPLIGVGGIDSGAAALAKIRAGATLIQLYSALIYRGLGLVQDIKVHLVGEMARARVSDLSSFVGTDAARLTAESWPA